MSDAHQTPQCDSIESAMSRLTANMPKTEESTAAAAAGARSVGRREYDQALSRRFEQIRRAQGLDAPPEAAPRPVGTAPAALAHGRVFGTRGMLLASLVSAFAGAGLMWLTMQHIEHNRRPAAPPTPAEAPRPTPPLALAGATAPPARAAGESEARDLVERWRAAWSSRDVESYLACYRSDFVPADGKARSDWAAARRKNISSRHDISVQVRDLQMTPIDANQWQATFRQDYAAGAYRESAQAKTLLLTRAGERWQIAGEWLGDSPPPQLARGQE